MNNGQRTVATMLAIVAVLLGLNLIVRGSPTAVAQGVLANGPVQGLEEIVLDAGFHHLGDNFFPSWEIPHPEGTILEITFLLNQSQIQRVKTAHFEFFMLGNNWSNVIVNGRRWSLPYTVDADSGFGLDIAAKTLFSIPTSLLDTGLNSIVFESTLRNGFDDFEVGEVVLLLLNRTSPQ